VLSPGAANALLYEAAAAGAARFWHRWWLKNLVENVAKNGGTNVILRRLMWFF
jgi:hypothetical protein